MLKLPIISNNSALKYIIKRLKIAPTVAMTDTVRDLFRIPNA